MVPLLRLTISRCAAGPTARETQGQGEDRQENRPHTYERHQTKRTVYFSKHLNADSAAVSSYISGQFSVRNIDVRSFLLAVFLICIFEDTDISNASKGECFSVVFSYIRSCAVHCLNDWMHDVQAQERLETAVQNDINRPPLRNQALI